MSNEMRMTHAQDVARIEEQFEAEPPHVVSLVGDAALGDETFESTLAFSPRRFGDVGVEHWARPFIDAMSSRLSIGLTR
jgi:hypothetical protein